MDNFFIKKIAADKLTPVNILEKLKANVLLESAYHETGRGKYSIIIYENAFTIIKENKRTYIKYPDKKFEELNGEDKYLKVIEKYKNYSPELPSEYNELPVPLGGLGYLGYEYFSEIENIKFNNKDIKGCYDSAFIFGRTFIIFDHLHDIAYIICVKYSNEKNKIDLKQFADRTEKALTEIKTSPEFNHPEITTGKIVSKNDKKEFIEKVKTIKDEIYKGNLIQCVISRYIEAKTDMTPIQTYRFLRMQNPSPYLFYLNFDKFVLFGASPEVMVKVKNGKVILRPIAGTIKRGIDIAEDNILANQMKNDPKELAEHLMLLDLGRNDIGKIAKGGTVIVTENKIIEKYSKVMHLVSEVQGDIDEKYSSYDAINATIPAGTVSGAPKIQAIKTIEKLEKTKRGPYAGLVGYFEKDGSLDSCISIRSAVYKEGRIFLQAGAGIVHDSIPEKEYIETQNKLMALAVALNINIEE